MFSCLPFLVALFAFLFVLADAARTNHTVDSGDRSISYFGSWEQRDDPPDIGGHHMETTDPSAYALFSFTGVAVYVSTKQPYPVTTDVAIDDQTPVSVDLQDPNINTGSGATIPAGVITGFTGLKNVSHTLRVSVHPGEKYAIVESFIYTTLDSDPTAPSSTPTSSIVHKVAAYNPSTPDPAVTNPAPPNSNTGSSNTSNGVVRKIALGAGIGGGILAVWLVILLTWCCIKRVKEKERRSHQGAPLSYTNAMMGGNGTFNSQPPPGTVGYLSSPASMTRLMATQTPPHTLSHSNSASIMAPGSYQGAMLSYAPAGVGETYLYQHSPTIPSHPHSPTSTSQPGTHSRTPSNLDEGSLGYIVNTSPQAPPKYSPPPDSSFYAPPRTKESRSLDRNMIVQPIPQAPPAAVGPHQRSPRLSPLRAPQTLEVEQNRSLTTSLSVGSGDLGSQSSDGTLHSRYLQPLRYQPDT